MVRIVRVFVCLALVATIIPLGCSEEELPDIEVPEPRDRLVEILQLTADQVEQLETGTGTLKLREDQVDILRDYVMQLLADLEPWLDEGQWQEVKNILESMLTEGEVDLEALYPVVEAINSSLAAMDEAEAGEVLYTRFGKLPSGSTIPAAGESILAEGSERATTVIIYTPKDSVEGHKRFDSGIVDGRTLGFGESIGSANEWSGALGVHADAPCPWCAAVTHARHRILIHVPADNTDVTVYATVLYTSGTTAFPSPPLNAGSTQKSVAAPHKWSSEHDLTYEVIDAWFHWTDAVKWAVKIVSLGGSHLVVKCAETAVSALWDLQDILGFRSALEEHARTDIVGHKAEGLSAGDYFFEVGFRSQATASIGLAGAFVVGMIPEIRVILDCDSFTLDVTSTGGGEVTEPGEGASMHCAGQNVKLVATPHTGYRFVNWTGDVSTIGNVNGASTTITMDGNYSITANFEEHTTGEYTPMVAAGGYHTVGLKYDGTAVAVGANTRGQCNVGDWTGIVQVAAGWQHTVGLRSDGSVVAVGWDRYGQCDVGDWTGTVQVATGSTHTVGLKADGSVVAVGWNDDGQCNVGGWTGIVQVTAGSTHTVGLVSDGSVVAVGSNYRGQCNVGTWTDIVQVAAGSYHTVGLKSDGSVIAVGSDGGGRCNVGDWAGIVQVAAGEYHTVGLKSDGSVVAVGWNKEGQCNVGDWTGIVQVAADVAHTAALKSDGSVVAVGWNDDGQCNVGDWNLL